MSEALEQLGILLNAIHDNTYGSRELDIDTRKKALNQTVVSEEKFLKLMENVVTYISKLTDLQQID